MDEFTNIPVIHTLDELIQALHKIFEKDEVNIDEVKAILSSYKSNPKEWRKFAKFDIHRYTRNLIDAGNGKFNLMALCWGESNGSSIHDHSDSHCFVKVLDGNLKETMYDWPEDEDERGMVQKGATTYEKDGVAYINDSMGLHRMENPSHSDRCVSMHLYCPPFSECKTFDERTGHMRNAKVTFWSQFGKRTPFVPDSSLQPSQTAEATSKSCCRDT